jgi:menaquinone-dependent protoporphyrinogen oxidase
MTVLVAYATKKGSTREVAEAVAGELVDHGLVVDLKPVDEVEGPDEYDAVVLGAALYMGHLHPDARKFLSHNRDALAALPVAVFAMGPFSLEEGQVAGSRKQLLAGLAHFPSLKPVSVAIFGGVLHPAEHHFPFSHMRESDARDWDAIRSWADDVAAELSAARPERLAGRPVAAVASSR